MTTMANSQTESVPMSALLNETPSRRDTLPPDYDEGQVTQLANIPSAATSTSSLPEYEAVAGASSSSASSTTDPFFQATQLFQIEASGQPLIALPLPPRPRPIPVLSVLPTGEIGGDTYQSIRAERSSGNSVLLRVGDNQPICTTTYRCGPNRPPRIQFRASDDGVHNAEEVEVISKGCTTRTQIIRTRLGNFQWRYANSSERRAVNADSLIVFDEVHTVELPGKKTEERRRRVAHLVRNDGVRTQGSKRSTAGNGGRLMMDLRRWIDGKGDAARMEALVISSCLVMLKKEVDRRRFHQTLAIMAAAGGGS